MSEDAFPPESLDAFRALYPEEAGKIAHRLAGHPMFELDALVALAKRIRPVDAEYNSGDLPVGIDPAATPSNGLSAEETIRRIEECGSWMVLKFVEQDAAIAICSIRCWRRSNPWSAPSPARCFTARLHLHFLARCGHSLSLRSGAQHPAADPRPEDHDRLSCRRRQDRERRGSRAFHNGGHRNLTWRDDFAIKGKPVELTPGEAVYVPVKAPHWVKNGPEVSISFSITWRSEWSYKEADARGLNRLLRKAGLNPSAPKRFPATNIGKSVAYRGMMKARRLLKAD
jgi:hypothetical protein